MTRTYLHGARGPEYHRIGSANPKWHLYDGLGSVVGQVDVNGNLTSTRKYDVYGAVRGLTGESGSKHKFVGGLGHPSEDETGLIYMRARYYDPVVGRFVSEDPGRHGTNWYEYAVSNPVNGVDLDGRFTLTELLIGGFIIGFLLSLLATVMVARITGAPVTLQSLLINGLVGGVIGAVGAFISLGAVGAGALAGARAAAAIALVAARSALAAGRALVAFLLGTVEMRFYTGLAAVLVAMLGLAWLAARASDEGDAGE